MWVRLTDRQLWHVYQAMDAWDAAIAAELRVNVLHPTTKRFEVEAPYVAWDTVRRVMMGNVYSPGGGSGSRSHRRWPPPCGRSPPARTR